MQLYELNLKKRVLSWKRRRQYKKQRIERGWCTMDLEDYDLFFREVNASMLDSAATHLDTRPSDMTALEWERKLREAAMCLRYSSVYAVPNIFKDQLGMAADTSNSLTDDEREIIRANFAREQARIQRDADQNFIRFLDFLKEYKDYLWI